MTDSFLSRLAQTWRPGERSRSIVGSLAFHDLSGYTRLTERLALLGRDGDEEINTTVNALFARLVDRVLDDDGDIVCFGGDAMLVLFDGDDHERRACRSAVAIQRDVARHGLVATSSGLVRMRVSGGIHTGAFTAVTVGPHGERRVVLVGPDVTAVVELEAQAQAGQVLLGDATAQAVPRSWWRRSGDAAHLRWRTPAIEVPEASGGLRAAELPPGEHRLAAVAFLKVGGLDRLFTGGHADEAVDALVRVSDVVATSCRRFGVTWSECDIATDGVKYLLLAGVPASHEDDDERLLRCVRAVADDTVDLPLTVAIGANTGTLFAGDLGSLERRIHTVMGDVVNVAARLAFRAAAGEVLVTPTLVERSAARYDTSGVQTFAVKGKRALQRGVTLGRLRERQRSHQATTLHGRDGEIGRLREAAIAATRSEGGCHEIIAPAGFGKSVLVAAALEHVDPHTIVRQAGDPYRRNVPFGVFAPVLCALLEVADEQALVAWCARVAPSLAPWLPLVAQAAGLDLPSTVEVGRLAPEFRARRLHESVIAAIDAARGRHPSVIVVDDAQWADDASLALVAALAREVRNRPWLLIVSHRPERPNPGWLADAGSVMELSALPRAAVRRIVIDAAGSRGLSDEEVGRLVARAAGHPLFARELVDGALSGMHELPRTIEQLVATRIDELDPADRLLLRCAAVAGPTVDPTLLAVCLEDPSIRSGARWSALDAFLEARDERLVFRHDLLREVAYRGLATRRRRVLHARFGTAMLEREPDPPASSWPVLAGHFHEGHLPGAAREFAVKAASAAAAAYEWSAAVPMLDIALACDDGGNADGDGVTRNRLLDARAVALERAGRLAEAERDYRRNVDHAAAARVVQRQGRLAPALRLARRAQRAGVDPIGVVDALLREASILHQTSRYRAALAAARRAVDLVGEDDQLSRGRALVQVHHSATALGQDADRVAEEALRCLREAGDDVALGNLLLNLGVEDTYRGRWVQAVRRSSEAADVFLRLGDTTGVLIARNNAAEVALQQGRLDVAREHFETVRRGFAAAGDAFMVACAEASLATIDVRLGEAARGEHALRRVREIHAGMSADEFVLDADLRLVEAALRVGRVDEALTMLDDAEPRARRLGSAGMNLAWARRLRAWALHASGRRQSARELMGDCLAAAVRHDSPAERALCLGALAVFDARDGTLTPPEQGIDLRDLVAALDIVALPPPTPDA